MIIPQCLLTCCVAAGMSVKLKGILQYFNTQYVMKFTNNSMLTHNCKSIQQYKLWFKVGIYNVILLFEILALSLMWCS